MTNKLTKEQVIEVIKTVSDPELGIDIWTLGLVYNLDLKKDLAEVKMTLTSPTCPFGPMIIEDLKTKLSNIGVNSQIMLVFDPPWQPSEELRAMLGV